MIFVASNKAGLVNVYIQGLRTQIDAYQTNIFSWFNDIVIKTQFQMAIMVLAAEWVMVAIQDMTMSIDW